MTDASLVRPQPARARGRASDRPPRHARNPAPPRPGLVRTSGFAALETLLAAPIVLLLGLTVLQWALVFHGRQAVAHAVAEAGRAGSVDHGSDEAIERGLARGLVPWLYGSTGPVDHAANQLRARVHLRLGQGAGWVDWRRLSPTAASFADWAEPARDARGIPVPGQLEIPNDNLSLRDGARQPSSGVLGHRAGEPIGRASGQTLADANLLKLEFTYGVPLTVPLVGRLAAWIMRGVDACGSVTGPGPRVRLGTVDLGAPSGIAGHAPRAWACAHYLALDERGLSKPRWPVRVSSTVRMQSPARTPAAVAAPPAQSGASHGLGNFDASSAERPPPPERVNPRGAGPSEDGSADRSPGFLKIGADRLLPPPLPACP